MNFIKHLNSDTLININDIRSITKENQLSIKFYMRSTVGGAQIMYTFNFGSIEERDRYFDRLQEFLIVQL